MPLKYERIRDETVDLIQQDDDQKYDTNNDGTNEVTKPDPTHPAFKALVHYIAKAVVQEIKNNGEVVGVQVDPSTGTQIKPGEVE